MKLNSPDLTVVIVNFNTGYLLKEAIGALRSASVGLNVSTIIIDNASKDDSLAIIRENFADCKLIANEVNVGFGRANNQALPFIQSKYVLLLNTDAFVSPDSITKSLDYMSQNDRCGILGVRLEGRDGKLQHCARDFPTPLKWFMLRTGLKGRSSENSIDREMIKRHDSIVKCDWVVGCYYFMRKEVIDSVGLFDPRFFLYFEEVDHCFRAKRAGWEIVYFPLTTVVHIGGESAKSTGAVTQSGRQVEALQVESELLYFRKHYGISGVFQTIIYNSISDFLDLIRSILGRDNCKTFSSVTGHIRMLWTLALSTRLGAKPTR